MLACRLERDARGDERFRYSGFEACGSHDQLDSLAAALKNVRGQWIATTRDTPEARASFAGCHFHALQTRSLLKAKQGKNETFSEMIVTP